MTAIDELKKRIDLEGIVREIAFKLDANMKTIGNLRDIRDLRSHTFNIIGNDKITALLSGTGLIGYERNHFGMGVYWYTPQAKELYEKLKKEGFYDQK